MIYGATGAAVFQVNTDGTGLRILKLFQNPLEGTNPNGDLVLAGGKLYGTTAGGGLLGEGTVFRLDLTPQLTIQRAGNNLMLSWPAYATGFVPEQSDSLLPGTWSTLAGTPADDGTNRTLVRPLPPLPDRSFYRLRK